MQKRRRGIEMTLYPDCMQTDLAQILIVSQQVRLETRSASTQPLAATGAWLSRAHLFIVEHQDAIIAANGGVAGIEYNVFTMVLVLRHRRCVPRLYALGKLR